MKLTPSSAAGVVVASVQRDIASMKTRGAGEIGKQAALALAKAAASYRGADLDELRRQLMAAARQLAAARPTAVSLRNGLNFVLDQALRTKDVATSQAAAQVAADAWVHRVAESKRRIAELGASLIRPGDTILTHCHSTAALGVLVEAHRQGKRPRVFATETRPFRQGLITSRALRDAGVDVTLIVDSATLHVLESEKVARVVIGADAVGADGSLYNKIGTRLITLAAHSMRVPVAVAAETYKFSPYTLEGEAVEIEERDPSEVARPDEVPGVKILNPVFDRTPPDQITTFVTDAGLLKPRQVGAFMRRQFGGAKRWI